MRIAYLTLSIMWAKKDVAWMPIRTQQDGYQMAIMLISVRHCTAFDREKKSWGPVMTRCKTIKKRKKT